MAKVTRTEKRADSAGLRITATDKMAKDISEVSMGVIMVLAALIGIWGIACLVGGAINSGGIGDLLGGYISAITGR